MGKLERVGGWGAILGTAIGAGVVGWFGSTNELGAISGALLGALVGFLLGADDTPRKPRGPAGGG